MFSKLICANMQQHFMEENLPAKSHPAKKLHCILSIIIILAILNYMLVAFGIS